MDLLIAIFWLGPALASAILAIRAKARRRFVIAAVAALLPLLAVEAWAISDVLETYDGFCRHAPDITYPCTLGTAISEVAYPSGGFTSFGWFVLSLPALAWGGACLLFASRDGFDGGPG